MCVWALSGTKMGEALAMGCLHTPRSSTHPTRRQGTGEEERGRHVGVSPITPRRPSLDRPGRLEQAKEVDARDRGGQPEGQPPPLQQQHNHHQQQHAASSSSSFSTTCCHAKSQTPVLPGTSSRARIHPSIHPSPNPSIPPHPISAAPVPCGCAFAPTCHPHTSPCTPPSACSSCSMRQKARAARSPVRSRFCKR